MLKCFGNKRAFCTSSSSGEQILEAARAGTLGFGFSGGGFMFPYFIGVLRVLREMNLISSTTPVAGSSAGSLMAASISCGLSEEHILRGFDDTARDCRAAGTYKRLSTVLATQLERQLPLDAHSRCNGITHVGITTVFPYLQPQNVTKFAQREDLTTALLASCHIPRISNGSLTTVYNNRVVLDGGITNLIPLPPGCTHTLKISCIPSSIIRRLPLLNKNRALAQIAIGPDTFSPWPLSFEETIGNSLRPGPQAFCDMLILAGASDTSKWAEANGLGRLLRARQEHVPHPLVDVVIGTPEQKLVAEKAAA